MESSLLIRGILYNEISPRNRLMCTAWQTQWGCLKAIDLYLVNDVFCHSAGHCWLIHTVLLYYIYLPYQPGHDHMTVCNSIIWLQRYDPDPLHWQIMPGSGGQSCYLHALLWQLSCLYNFKWIRDKIMLGSSIAGDYFKSIFVNSWICYDMDTFTSLLWEESPNDWWIPITRGQQCKVFILSVDSLNKMLSKQMNCWWKEMPWCTCETLVLWEFWEKHFYEPLCCYS